MTDDVALIIQLPAGSAVDRQLELDPPPSVASGRAVIERITADVEGTIQPPVAGQVVLSFLSPEDLRREAEQVRQEIRPDGGGEPPVVVIEVAEELREDELASLLQAADEASRVVILCILGSVLAKGLGRRLSAPRPRDRSQRNDQTKLRTASSAGGMRARSHSATISRA